MEKEKIGQTFIDGTLRWYRSTVESDGDVIEEDGVGFSPESIRSKLLEEEGEWELMVDEPVDKLAVVRVMRSVMHLDMAVTAGLLNRLPGVVYTGTRGEADWLKWQLLKCATTVHVRRLT